MSQRNPMNERYQTDNHKGVSRRSAASAKPKSKAAASVTYSSPKKTPKDRKAEQKAARKEEAARQREIDRKYYTPDTARYKKLRKIWWASLIGAVVCTAASWFLRGVKPEWLAFGCLILAYILIIFAFYIDFSKIRKERKAYQTRMIALELEQEKQAKREEIEARRHSNKSKGKGKQMTAAQKRAAASANSDKDDNADDAAGDDAASAPADEAASAKKFGGFFKRKDNAQESDEKKQETA